MTDQDEASTANAVQSDERLAIGISFGNSYSSIAHTSNVSRVIYISVGEIVCLLIWMPFLLKKFFI